MTEVNDDICIDDRNEPAHRKGKALIVSVRARQVRRALAKLVVHDVKSRPVTILSMGEVYSRQVPIAIHCSI